MICNSCGLDKKRKRTPHHQPDNSKVWDYCRACKRTHEVEVKKLDAYWVNYLERLTDIGGVPELEDEEIPIK